MTSVKQHSVRDLSEAGERVMSPTDARLRLVRLCPEPDTVDQKEEILAAVYQTVVREAESGEHVILWLEDSVSTGPLRWVDWALSVLDACAASKTLIAAFLDTAAHDGESHLLWAAWSEALRELSKSGELKTRRVVAFVPSAESNEPCAPASVARAFLEQILPRVSLTVITAEASPNSARAIVRGVEFYPDSEIQNLHISLATPPRAFADKDVAALKKCCRIDDNQRISRWRKLFAELHIAKPSQLVAQLDKVVNKFPDSELGPEPWRRRVVAERVLFLLLLGRISPLALKKILDVDGFGLLYEVQFLKQLDTEWEDPRLESLRDKCLGTGADSSSRPLVAPFTVRNEALDFLDHCRDTLADMFGVPVEFGTSETNLPKDVIRAILSDDKQTPAGHARFGGRLLLKEPTAAIEELNHVLRSDEADAKPALARAFRLLGDLHGADGEAHRCYELGERQARIERTRADSGIIALQCQAMTADSRNVVNLVMQELERTTASESARMSSQKELLKCRLYARVGDMGGLQRALKELERATYDTVTTIFALSREIYQWCRIDYTESQAGKVEEPKYLPSESVQIRLRDALRIAAVAELVQEMQAAKLGPYDRSDQRRPLVAISYKKGDRKSGGSTAEAMGLKSALEKKDYDVFIDTVVEGNWSTDILENFLMADCIVALVTPAYAQSPWCRVEQKLSLARADMGRHTFAYRYVKLGGEQKDSNLRRFTPIDIGEISADWAVSHFDKVVDAVERGIAHVRRERGLPLHSKSTSSAEQLAPDSGVPLYSPL